MLDYNREQMNNGAAKTFEHPEGAQQTASLNTSTQVTDVLGMKYLVLGCALIIMLIACCCVAFFVMGLIGSTIEEDGVGSVWNGTILVRQHWSISEPFLRATFNQNVYQGY